MKLTLEACLFLLLNLVLEFSKLIYTNVDVLGERGFEKRGGEEKIIYFTFSNFSCIDRVLYLSLSL